MWLGYVQPLAKVRLDGVPVLSSQLRVVDTKRNLGVVVESQLLYVAAVCRGGYYQLRHLRPLKRCMTDEAIKTPTHAFISSRLYCCDVLYCGIAEGLLSRLQSVQNAAARLVTVNVELMRVCFLKPTSVAVIFK